jgi:hypothetical protein
MCCSPIALGSRFLITAFCKMELRTPSNEPHCQPLRSPKRMFQIPARTAFSAATSRIKSGNS